MSLTEAEITYKKAGLLLPIFVFMLGVFLAWFFYNSIPQLAIFGIILIFSSTLSLFVVLAKVMGARVIIEQAKTREKERKIKQILKEIEEREVNE